jgi:hypothetical protein
VAVVCRAPSTMDEGHGGRRRWCGTGRGTGLAVGRRQAAAERWVAAAVGCLLSNEKQNGTERWARGS